MNKVKDLTKEPPRSPRVRVGGYAILARMADKGRATLVGLQGEYHFDCPLDKMLFGFKGVGAQDVKQLLASGKSDEEIAAWLDVQGAPKTEAEVEAWSDSIETIRPYENPEIKDHIIAECTKLGLDPVTTLPDYLEADDRASFKN
jgi:hypothetical protein